MRKGFGICCIVLGVCCLISSLGLIAYNRWEEENAQDVSMNILQDVQENMPEICKRVIEGIKAWATIGADRAMNVINTKPKPKENTEKTA